MRLSRTRILAARRRVTHLDRRLPFGPDAIRRAAWAGLTDSMPRAAVLSLHARLDGVGSDVLDHEALVQLWGPRFSAYVVASEDRAVFTLGRLPTGGAALERAVETADRLDALLGDQEMPYAEAGRALGFSSGNALRYAAPTGRVLLGWEGSGKPTIRMAPAPEIDPWEARLELARRYLHVFGPATSEAFGRWAGIKPPPAADVFERLEPELVAVTTPMGRAWILGDDAALFADDVDLTGPEATGRIIDGPVVRLLPSGDTYYYLLQAADRELLVAEAERRDRLWTSRVWPGAVLVDGAIVGIWRRSAHKVTIEPWRRLSAAVVRVVEDEVASLPLPEPKPMVTTWA